MNLTKDWKEKGNEVDGDVVGGKEDPSLAIILMFICYNDDDDDDDDDGDGDDDDDDGDHDDGDDEDHDDGLQHHGYGRNGDDNSSV